MRRSLRLMCRNASRCDSGWGEPWPKRSRLRSRHIGPPDSGGPAPPRGRRRRSGMCRRAADARPCSRWQRCSCCWRSSRPRSGGFTGANPSSPAFPLNMRRRCSTAGSRNLMILAQMRFEQRQPALHMISAIQAQRGFSDHAGGERMRSLGAFASGSQPQGGRSLRPPAFRCRHGLTSDWTSE
jgi:hypothetical protein